MIQASTHLFRNGVHLALAGGVIALMCFAGTIRTRPSRLFRGGFIESQIAFYRLARWVFLVLTIVGLTMMLVAKA
jgi:hypothetical protein